MKSTRKQQIYLVTTDCYSGYRLDKIFYSLHNAIDYVLSLKTNDIDDYDGYGYRIEKWEIDDSPIGCTEEYQTLYCISITSETIGVSKLDVSKYKGFVIKSFRVKSNPTQYGLEVSCFADNEQEAIEIAKVKFKEWEGRPSWN